MKHRFIEHLANEEEFIFVDKVVAHQKVDIEVTHHWEYKSHYMRCGKIVNGTHIEFRFSNIKNTKRTYLTSGYMSVEVSFPKLVCLNNISAVPVKDSKTICGTVNHALREIGAKGVWFENFTITKIELSISFYFKCKEKEQEADRLFRASFIAGHKPGIKYIRVKNKGVPRNGDFKNGYYHGSPSDNLLLYNKTEEQRSRENLSSDIWAVLNTLPDVYRLEIQCNQSTKKIECSRWTVEQLLNSGNVLVVEAFKNHQLGLDFVPMEEYFFLVTKHLSETRKQKKENAGKSKYRYLKHSDEVLISFLELVNRKGAKAACDDNDELYRRCIELTSDIGINILFTKLKERFNFFEIVISNVESGTYSIIDVCKSCRRQPFKKYTFYFQRGIISHKNILITIMLSSVKKETVYINNYYCECISTPSFHRLE